MRIQLKPYQDKAIHNRKDGLLPMTLNVLSDVDDSYMMILKSIMGSGKTVIAAGYIEELFETDRDERGEKDTCIIWLSKGNGKLHMQSFEKLKGLIEPHDIQIFGIEDSSDFNSSEFEDKQVYIINWEKLKEKNSNLLDFTEHSNVRQALNNTDLDSINFIFIVDEFHLNYEKDTYNLMIELFHPVFVVGMTATPSEKQMGKANYKHVVPVDDVIGAGMIKKGICFNTINDFDDKAIDQYNTVDEFFLRMALKQRDVLEQHFRDSGSDVIPLLLIQFDDDVNNDDIKLVREQLDIEYDDNKYGDYAIWVTDNARGDEKLRTSEELLSNISTNNVKVLMFKQAVATGWDCPRACVLLRYRKVARQKDAKAVSAFDIQTLGRIVRMPEPSKFDNKNIKHYEDDILNYGYVFVPSQKYELEDEFKKAYEGTDYAKRPSSRSRSIIAEAMTGNDKKSIPDSNRKDDATSGMDDSSETMERANNEQAFGGNKNTFDNIAINNDNVDLDGKIKTISAPQNFYEENKFFIENVECALKGQNYRVVDSAPDELSIVAEIRSIFNNPDVVRLEKKTKGIERVVFSSRRLEISDELLDAASDGNKKVNIQKDKDAKEISVNLENPIIAYNEAERYVDRLLKSKRGYGDNAREVLKQCLLNKLISFVEDKGQSKEECLGQAGRILLNNKAAIIRVFDELDEYIVANKKYTPVSSDFKFAENVRPLFDVENKSYEHEVLSERASEPEKVFAELLDDPNSNVQFWYKCPDKGPDAFVVIYEKVLDVGRGNTRTKTEYCCPDFIVALKDGSIGIYETKIKGDYNGKVPDETNAIEKRIMELNKNDKGYIFYGGLIHVDTKNDVLVEAHPELGLN